MADLDSPVQYLKGVGPAFAKKFAKLGIVTVRDLLLCYPRKYIDYTQPYAIAEAPYDADCCVRATRSNRDGLPISRCSKESRRIVRFALNTAE